MARPATLVAVSDPTGQDAPSDVAPALAALPLFPLPAVLFPGALMELYVFEPRYRTLVKDILESHHALGIVFIADANAVDRHGHPRIAEVATVGTIVHHVELTSGRFNILVRGRSRVTLSELPFAPPYRRAQAAILPDAEGSPAPESVMSLVSAIGAFTSIVRNRDPSFDFRLPKDADGATMADLAAHYLIIDPRERQRVLEMRCPDQRVQSVTEALALQRLTLAPEAQEIN